MADESWVPLNIQGDLDTVNTISITVPDNMIYEIHTVRSRYQTNAVGNDRIIILKIEFPSTSLEIMEQYPSTVGQAVSLNYNYQWGVGVADSFAINTLVAEPEIHLSLGSGPKFVAPGGIITVFDENNESSAVGETATMRITGRQLLLIPHQGGVGDNFTSDMIVFGSS